MSWTGAALKPDGVEQLRQAALQDVVLHHDRQQRPAVGHRRLLAQDPVAHGLHDDALDRNLLDQERFREGHHVRAAKLAREVLLHAPERDPVRAVVDGVDRDGAQHPREQRPAMGRRAPAAPPEGTTTTPLLCYGREGTASLTVARPAERRTSTRTPSQELAPSLALGTDHVLARHTLGRVTIPRLVGRQGHHRPGPEIGPLAPTPAPAPTSPRR